MNDLYRLTRCATPYDYPEPGNPGAVKMGTPESWFQMASPDGDNVQPMKPYADKVDKYSMFGYERPQEYRIPKGATVTLVDTYLYLRPTEQPDNPTVCRNFVEMLGDVYQFIYKPPVIKTDWANDVVPKMVKDIMRPENTGTVQGKHKLPRAYVGYEHEDNQLWTVLNLLHPLELYVKKFPQQQGCGGTLSTSERAVCLCTSTRSGGGFHNNIAPINQDQLLYRGLYLQPGGHDVGSRPPSATRTPRS